MKVILYMAISADGMIANSNDDASWISKEEWDSYSLTVRNAGCVIVGRRTYHILTSQPEFSELADVKVVVVSSENFNTLSSKHVVVHSPKEALECLKDFPEIIVAGGGILNAAFMSENLVDEIYLDIEPVVIGKGIPLFQGKQFEQQLQLIGTKQLSKNEIQLHYSVRNSELG
jgi:dihydrofolate reductase